MSNKISDIIIGILLAVLTIFAAFITYQIFLALSGGSWSNENIIIALLILNIGCTFTIGLALGALNSDHKHLKNQFRHFATDFKEYIKLRS